MHLFTNRFLIVRSAALLLLASSLLARKAHAFAYIFAGEGTENRVAHPLGYTGAGGVLTITVGLNPANTFAGNAIIAVNNLIHTWNQLVPTTGNLVFGTNNNIPAGQIDWESTILHELGHSLGLSHPNLASESGLPDPAANSTKSTDGANNTYNTGAGVDGVFGSSDDVRGDDGNLNWFRKSNNNPFSIAATVDSTTYSRNLADLPGGHAYSTNPDRTVASSIFGLANTEASLQQGQGADEAQRTLGHDDVAGIRYAMSGLDELQGTADDYTIFLLYAGITSSADIVISENTSGLASSGSSGSLLNANHVVISSTSIVYNNTVSWFFNPERTFFYVPEPGTFALGTTGLFALRYARRKSPPFSAV